jgi:(2Fe-2S) ferredoxin
LKGDDKIKKALEAQPARPRTQHYHHHYTKVKPEAATAVIELLMMGGKTPETC